MLSRFNGPEGHRRLVQALRQQYLIQNDDSLASELSSNVTLVELRAKEQLIAQNGVDNDIYFIISGQVAIVVHNREIAIRRAGTHVGEMALIDQSAKRSASVIAVEQTVVAKITEPTFIFLANKYPKVWKQLAIELSNRLRERNKYVSIPNALPLIFIGSSKESLNIAKLIQSGLTSEDIVVRLWTDDVFRPSRATIEDLEVQIKSADYAVLVFGPDDTIISRNVVAESPRDNVLVELGMFMGAIGRERTYFVLPRGIRIKVPSDLFGLTPIQYTPGTDSELPTLVAPACNEIRRSVERLGSK